MIKWFSLFRFLEPGKLSDAVRDELARTFLPEELASPLPFHRWAKIVLPVLVRSELTATAALLQFRKFGGRIRTSDWYEMWRIYARPHQYSDIIAKWDYATKIPDRYVSQLSPFARWNYQMTYEVVYFDPDTLKKTTKYVSVVSDEDRLPGFFDSELEKLLKRKADEYHEAGLVEPISIRRFAYARKR